MVEQYQKSIKTHTHTISSMYTIDTYLDGLFFFLFSSYFGCFFAEGLAGFLSGFLVSHVVPESGFFVELEESSRWVLGSPLADNVEGHQGFVQSFAVDVIEFAFLNHFAVSLVARMVVRSTTPAVHDIVLVRLLNVPQRPICVLFLWRRRRFFFGFDIVVVVLDFDFDFLLHCFLRFRIIVFLLDGCRFFLLFRHFYFFAKEKEQRREGARVVCGCVCQRTSGTGFFVSASTSTCCSGPSVYVLFWRGLVRHARMVRLSCVCAG